MEECWMIILCMNPIATGRRSWSENDLCRFNTCLNTNTIAISDRWSQFTTWYPIEIVILIRFPCDRITHQPYYACNSNLPYKRSGSQPCWSTIAIRFDQDVMYLICTTNANERWMWQWNTYWSMVLLRFLYSVGRHCTVFKSITP